MGMLTFDRDAAASEFKNIIFFLLYLVNKFIINVLLKKSYNIYTGLGVQVV